MALAEPASDQREKLDNALSLNLNSRNPFLNPRTGSPALPSPNQVGPQSAPLQQQKSTNPFLAAFETEIDSKSPPKSMETEQSAAQKLTIGEDAKELFKRLTINDNVSLEDQNTSPRRKPVSSSRRGNDERRPSRPEDTQYKRGPNGLRIPIRPRPGRSDRDRHRRDGSRERRPRRNSDSSAVERQVTEEDRAERERRLKEREAKNRDASRDSRRSSEAQRHSSRKSKRHNVHVDVVDKLDVTGLYGVGGMWHHDGPFDACRPHRNSKKNAFAPINAFPMNSANNTIGGSGPVNPGINLEQFHGTGTEGFHDYGGMSSNGLTTTNVKPFTAMATAVVNPINRVEPVHGEESLGLGTSTFLEGAPASRQAIQRTQSEQGADGGITRKKSIAMRLRGMSQSRRYPDGYPGPGGAPALPSSPPPPLKSPSSASKGRFQDRSAGITLTDGSPLTSPEPQRPATAGRASEINPFEKVEEVDEKKAEAEINVAETRVESPTRETAALGSPKRAGIERRATDNDESGNPKPTGFLSRVKSLKGNRKKGDRQAS